MNVRRGDVFLADLSPVVGSEFGGYRPVLVVSNDINNRNSTTVHVLPISSKVRSKRIPTHVFIAKDQCNLKTDSIVMAEQGKTIDKLRLSKRVDHFTADIMNEVDKCLLIQLDIGIREHV